MSIQSAGTMCQVVDAKGNRSAAVQRGDWVVWKNEMDRDVRLEFPATQRLFGVVTAVVYANSEPLRLQLRKDAVEGEFGYMVDIGVTYPGPIIIVPPPPGP